MNLNVNWLPAGLTTHTLFSALFLCAMGLVCPPSSCVEVLSSNISDSVVFGDGTRDDEFGARS